MACRYFSCSRLLDDSEDEAGAEDKNATLISHIIYQFMDQTKKVKASQLV